MARKKKETPPAPGSPAWMATFGDLMNLLLCFFVLLFSMSNVDADKYEALVTSLTDSVSIFDGGGMTNTEGALLSNGAGQMVQIEQYFETFEEAGEGDEQTAKSQEKTENNEQGESIAVQPGQNSNTISEESLVMYEQQMLEEQKQITQELYEEIMELAEKKQVIDYMNIKMDEGFQYVQISMKGAILFDSGKAEIKKGAETLLGKVGDILKLYDRHRIKIEGHTDNVPISGSEYKSNMWLSTARATMVFEYLTDKKKMDADTLEACGRGEYDPIDTNKTEKGRARNRRVEIKIYNAEN